MENWFGFHLLSSIKKKAASLSFKAYLFRDKTVENEQVRLHIKNIQSWVTSQKGRKNALKRKIKRKKMLQSSKIAPSLKQNTFTTRITKGIVVCSFRAD